MYEKTTVTMAMMCLHSAPQRQSAVTFHFIFSAKLPSKCIAYLGNYCWRACGGTWRIGTGTDESRAGERLHVWRWLLHFLCLLLFVELLLQCVLDPAKESGVDVRSDVVPVLALVWVLYLLLLRLSWSHLLLLNLLMLDFLSLHIPLVHSLALFFLLANFLLLTLLWALFLLFWLVAKLRQSVPDPAEEEFIDVLPVGVTVGGGLVLLGAGAEVFGDFTGTSIPKIPFQPSVGGLGGFARLILVCWSLGDG